MRRLLCFVATAGLAMGLFTAAHVTAAHAETFSFTVGGHHISISASRNCYRADCVSVSIPGIVSSHRKHNDDVVTAQDAAPAKPVRSAPAVTAPTPAPQIAPAALPLQTRATVAPPASPPSPPPAAKLAASDIKEVAAPPPPPPAKPAKIAATETPAPPPPAQPITDNPPVAAQPPVTPPPAVALAAPDPAPVPKVVSVADTERDDTPLGDWQTEGKVGAVRIEACGKALCGYLINPSSHAKAETILINMKPRGDGKSTSDTEWRGSIFSRASGNTYNAVMTLKAANLLRVEACALGHFLCTGNNWTRIIKEPAALVTSRDDDGEPRS
jgi:uncharacterized protein (DUF2147 family)